MSARASEASRTRLRRNSGGNTQLTRSVMNAINADESDSEMESDVGVSYI